MRQVILNGGFGLDHLHVVDAPRPQPGPGQVLVEMRAASLNYRDYLVAVGRYNPKMPLPRVPLSDGAGVVAELGPGVTRWKPGDHVAGIFMQSWLAGPYQDRYAKSALGGAIDGVLAEYVLFPESALVAPPPHWSFEQAATLPCAALTAWNALFESGSLSAGQSVLVQGSGGVSVFALSFAHAVGAQVIATTSSAAKAERLRALGAGLVVNYRDTPEWGKHVAQLGGVDHIVEVGGVATLEQSFVAVKGGGSISVIGILSGIKGELNIAPILHKHLRLQGIYVGSAEMFEHMVAFLSRHQIQPVLDSVYEMADIKNALRHMEHAGHFGKIVIQI